MSESFLAELAKPQPDPGGGAAAAHGALIALALLKKIFMLEYDRIQANNHSENWDNKKNELDSLFARMERLREEDRQIYPRMVLLRNSQSEKELIQIIEDSIAVPLRIMTEAIEGLALVSWVGPRSKEILKADLRVSAELLEASVQGAYHIGWANLPMIRKFRSPVIFDQELQTKRQEGKAAFQKVMTILSSPMERASDDSYCR
jgi:formiminotetrahydrofolate cyclodeaminase